MKRSTFRLMLCIVFVFILFVPLLESFFDFFELPRLEEKRRLADFPDFPDSFTKLSQFPQKFSAYYKDHFEFRTCLIRLNNLILYPFTGAIFPGSIIKGEGGWLYYTYTGYYKLCESFTRNQVRGIVNRIKKRIDALEKRNIKYYQIIIPNKSTLYPEFRPLQFKDTGIKSIRQKYLEEIDGTVAERTLDLFPYLWKQRHDRLLFSKSDFHWNHRGAEIAAKAIAEKLGLVDIHMPVLSSRMEPGHGGEFLRMMGISTLFRDQFTIEPASLQGVSLKRQTYFNHHNDGKEIYESENKSLPRILIFHDSFGRKIKPFLSHLGSAVRFVWLPEVNLSEIEVFAPDIVIQFVLENGIHTYNKDVFTSEKPYTITNVSPRFLEINIPNRNTPLVFEIKPKNKYKEASFIAIENMGTIIARFPITRQGKTEHVSFFDVNRAEELQTNLKFYYQELPDSSSPLPFAVRVRTGGKDRNNCFVGINNGVLYRAKGYNLYHIASDGNLLKRLHFNTSWSSKESDKMAAMLPELRQENGYLLLVSRFDGARRANQALQNAFNDMGSSVDLLNSNHRIHALLYNLDTGKIIEEKFSTGSQVAFTIGDFHRVPGFEISSIRFESNSIERE